MNNKQKKILRIKCFIVFICFFIAFSVGFEYLAILEALGVGLGFYYAGLAFKKYRSFYEAQFVYGWRFFFPLTIIVSIRIFLQILVGDRILQPDFLINLTKLNNWNEIQSTVIPICSLFATISLLIPIKTE